MTRLQGPAAAFNTPAARKTSTRRNSRMRYGFWSSKSGPQKLDGYTEFLWAMSFELNASVHRYKAQPERIKYTKEDGRPGHTTPDFLVDYGLGRLRMLECKPEKLVKKYEHRTKACIEHYALCQVKYEVVTEVDIEFGHPYRHFNARQIFDRRMQEVPYEFPFRVSEAFAKGAPKTLGDLKEILGITCPDNLYKLHIDGYLFIDYFEDPLGNDTKVSKLRDFVG